jgi:superfamily II DNA or RNA helicase
MDGENILDDFCGRTAEIRLPEALNKKILSPFQYFGITDSIDLTCEMGKGRYVASELTSLYTKNNIRVSEIISNLEKYLNDINDVRTLGFCVTVEHAFL